MLPKERVTAALERLLAMHRAFRARNNERPLFHITSGPRRADLQQLCDPLADGLLLPDAIAPARLVRPFATTYGPLSDFSTRWTPRRPQTALGR